MAGSSTIDPEEVENEFEEGVDEIPDLDDEDPEVAEPDFAAESDVPEATTAAAADFSSAETVDDLSSESSEILTSLESAVDDVPANALSISASLTEDDIEAMLDLDQDLPDGVDADAIVASLPDDIIALLPQINYDFSSSASSTVIPNGINVLNSGVDLDPVAQAVDAPCEDVYNDAYDDVIADLQATRDEQLATVFANFERRSAAAEDRFNSRTETLNNSADEFAAEIEAIAEEFLLAAEGLDFAEEELRLMAFLVALEGRIELQSWYDAASTVISNARTTEETTIEERRDDRESTVNSNYQNSADQAREILVAGIAACHNQGSGS
ncbi:hypothetical protein [Zunongwangia atlantica]|nr:hypothetical protein [Zunongwangia atlantica]